MIPVINDIDRLLQAAPFRLLNPNNADILLTPSASSFHVDAAGIPDIDSITVTATLIGLEGDISFSVQGAVLSDVTDKSATLTYASTAGGLVILTATVVSAGEEFTRSCVIPTLRDGVSGGGAKVVILTPSAQVFKINKAGDNDIASITLDAIGQNTSGTPNFTIPAGTATLSAGASSSQKILTFANMATDSVTIKVTLDGQTDQVTIIKVREGVDGIDAIAAVLSNESVTLTADAAGAVASLTGAVCTMHVYKGIADDSASWAYVYAPPSSAGGLAYTVDKNTITVTGFAAGVDVAFVDITASRVGFASITKRFSVSKSKAGAGGAGTVGDRGAGQYYATGSSWSDVVADMATPGSNMIGDQVTISNGTVTYTKRWDGDSWEVPGAYLGGDLFVEQGIHGSKLKVGTVEVRKPDGTLLLGVNGDFGGTVTARNLRVGTPDNIMPDPKFKDLAWWGRIGSAVGQFAEAGIITGWKGGASLYLAQNAGELSSDSQYFDLVPGATYRIEVQVGLSNDFNGRASVFLFIPGDRYYQMVDRDTGQRWADSHVVQLNAASPKGIITYATTYAIPASGTLSKGLIQIRNSHTIGNVEVGSVSITRVADGSLVGDGVLEARHIVGDTLDVLAAKLGMIELIGALFSGQTAYDTGVGLRLGTDIGDPYLSMRSASGKYFRVRPGTDTFEFNNVDIAGGRISQPSYDAFTYSVASEGDVSGPNGQLSSSVTLTVTGNNGPHSIVWSWSRLSGGIPSTPVFMDVGDGGRTASISATASNTTINVQISAVVTGIDGRTLTYNDTISLTFGTA